MLEFRQIDDFIVNYQVYIWECRLLQRILVPHRIIRIFQINSMENPRAKYNKFQKYSHVRIIKSFLIDILSYFFNKMCRNVCRSHDYPIYHVEDVL